MIDKTGGDMEKKNVLVVIDGMSVFYRGYYAMGDLAKSDGTPTSGVFGFATIAMEIVRKLQPTKVVVAWDKAHTSTTRRLAIYPEYKAGRVKPPEDFYAQIPLLKELVGALSWNLFECDNYEADDIIGTLAKQADEDLDERGECKWMTYIVSSDLDMLQIVDENTRMYRILKGFSDLQELDVPAVEAKYGILKSQFLDFKALKGDSSDNIPGVAGVGEKTAAKLLNEYGTLEGIYQNIATVPEKLRAKLLAGKESAFMSKELAKILDDAPVKLEDAVDFKMDMDRAVAALRELEFFSLIRKFKGGLMKEGSEVASDKSGVDDVGSGGVGVGRSELTVPEGLLIVRDVKAKMHSDPEFAEKILGGAEFWDLTQADFLLDPLKRVEKPEQMDLFGAMETEEDLRREYLRQRAEFEKNPKLFQVYKEFDLPLVPVLYKMEREGILINKPYFKTLQEEYAQEVEAIEGEIFEMVGESFNVGSPLQLGDMLFNRLRLPTKGIKKTMRGYSTGVKELEKLRDAHPVVGKVMEYREASKLLTTYIIPLPEQTAADGRVHTTFTQNVTATGRLSSVNPNLQNIPVRSEAGKRIRVGMVAAPGKKFVAADYAQFELRLAAVLAGDRKLMETFNSGVDVHTQTAAEVFGVPMEQVTKAQRRAAKVINFGVMYGMSVNGLAQATEMQFWEAKRFIDDYFRVRKPIKEYLESILNQARVMGYVETYYGRRRPTPDVNSTNGTIRKAAERAAQNMPIQGTEADLMKRAMIKLDAVLPEGAKLVLQVHDSLVVECDEEQVEQVARILQETMEGVAPELSEVKLAVDVKIGDNLGEV